MFTADFDAVFVTPPRAMRTSFDNPFSLACVPCFVLLPGCFVFALCQQMRQVWDDLEASGEDMPSSSSSSSRALKTAQEAEDLVAQEVEVRLKVIWSRENAPPISSRNVSDTEKLL